MKKVFIVIVLVLAALTMIIAWKGNQADTGDYLFNNDRERLKYPIGTGTEKVKEAVIPGHKDNDKILPESPDLGITASGAILVDQNSGKIYYQKAADKRCYPASTTKILTALVALENGNPDDIISVGDEANLAPTDSSKAGIRFGEKYKLTELLKCLLIPSGNDAAYVIAAYIGRKASGHKDMSLEEAIDYFCRMMNSRAEKAGAVNSAFINPDGYHDPGHYTTPEDIAHIARETMKNKTFREIVKMQSYSLPDIKVKDKNGRSATQARLLNNTDKLIIPDSGFFYKYATGIKTGHTGEAGYCLVSSASCTGRSVIAVVMDSTEKDVWKDSRLLLDYGLLKDKSLR